MTEDAGRDWQKIYLNCSKWKAWLKSTPLTSERNELRCTESQGFAPENQPAHNSNTAPTTSPLNNSSNIRGRRERGTSRSAGSQCGSPCLHSSISNLAPIPKCLYVQEPHRGKHPHSYEWRDYTFKDQCAASKFLWRAEEKRRAEMLVSIGLCSGLFTDVARTYSSICRSILELRSRAHLQWRPWGFPFPHRIPLFCKVLTRFKKKITSKEDTVPWAMFYKILYTAAHNFDCENFLTFLILKISTKQHFSKWESIFKRERQFPGCHVVI